MATTTTPWGEDESIVGINVTPLVDITLVLLVVFMVTARIIAAQAIPFELPKANTASEEQVVFTVTIDGAGSVQADGRPVGDDLDLRRAAQSALASHADLRTVVEAAAAVPHGEVVHVLDELRIAGVQRIAFGVDALPQGASRAAR
jgi:biopolymer transport protein ExbD